MRPTQGTSTLRLLFLTVMTPVPASLGKPETLAVVLLRRVSGRAVEGLSHHTSSPCLSLIPSTHSDFLPQADGCQDTPYSFPTSDLPDQGLCRLVFKGPVSCL